MQACPTALELQLDLHSPILQMHIARDPYFTDPRGLWDFFRTANSTPQTEGSSDPSQSRLNWFEGGDKLICLVPADMVIGTVAKTTTPWQINTSVVYTLLMLSTDPAREEKTLLDTWLEHLLDQYQKQDCFPDFVIDERDRCHPRILSLNTAVEAFSGSNRSVVSDHNALQTLISQIIKGGPYMFAGRKITYRVVR